MTLFNLKMGVIGDEKVDVNSFINYQIEICYKKIEAKLTTEVENTYIMKDRIKRLGKLPKDEKGKIIDEDHKNAICQKWLDAKAENKYHDFVILFYFRINVMEFTVLFILKWFQSKLSLKILKKQLINMKKRLNNQIHLLNFGQLLCIFY